ncbi:uncharacterized protein BKA78DRAFT_61085 [Phyllosticta capitalensis]|uniref:uncharacterized protein n=1 Tax=Phyllosticta capitalensis TaxID=121624 RepID=UPI00312FE893
MTRALCSPTTHAHAGTADPLLFQRGPGAEWAKASPKGLIAAMRAVVTAAGRHAPCYKYRYPLNSISSSVGCLRPSDTFAWPPPSMPSAGLGADKATHAWLGLMLDWTLDWAAASHCWRFLFLPSPRKAVTSAEEWSEEEALAGPFNCLGRPRAG